MKAKRVFAIAMAGLMALSVAVSAASFSDVNASTPEGKAINALADKGVLGGFEDGTFGPEKTVTRAQFAKIMFALKNDGKTDASANANDNKFVDVTSEKWFAGYVNWCASKNIVGGVGDGKFDPDSTLTMAQAIKMYAVAQGGAQPTLAYPQGFIDFAKDKNYFKDTNTFSANDPAPRGQIALIGFNSLGDAPSTDSGKGNAVITKIDGSKLTIANADENGRGNVPSAKTKVVNPTEPPKGVTTTYNIDESSVKTLEVASDAVIKVVDGNMGSDVAAVDGKLADVKASTDSEYYSCTYEAKDGKITALTFYKKSAAKEIYEAYDKLIAVPIEYSVYYNPGATIALNLYNQPKANPKDLAFGLTELTQPAKGAVDFSEIPAKFWRVRYTQPKDSKVGDVTSFTYTLETTDGAIQATGTVRVHIVEPTKVPDKEFTVTVDEIVDFDTAKLREGIQHTLGAPFGVSSFLIYNEETGKEVPSGTTYKTKGGAELTRSSGDVFTYIAPSEPCTDKIILLYHDGWDFSKVNVTVNVVG